MQSVSHCTGWTRKIVKRSQCKQCRIVMRTMYRVLNEMPDLRAAYIEMFSNKSDKWRKFITGCHLLRDKDLATWIIMVLSKKENQPISFKRKINSLEYVPEPGVYQRIMAMDGDSALKKLAVTGDAMSSESTQETPPLMS